MDEQTYELINQYLQGKLAGRALDEFKNRLKDPAFKQQVELQEQLVEAVKEVRKEELKKVFNEVPKVRYIQNQWGNKWSYASAAIVVLFVSAFFIIKFFAGNERTQVTSDESGKEHLEVALEDSLTETRVDTTALALETPVPKPPEVMILEETISEAVEESNAITAIEQDSEMLKTVFEADKAPAAAEQMEVKKDELMASKFYSVKVLAYKSPSQVERAEIQDSSISDEDSDELDAGVTEDAIAAKSRILTRSIQVEFWSSPVHFKGYQYTGNTLKLYGLEEGQISGFIELDQHLYLKQEATFYFLKKNEDYNKFTAVSNPTLLKVLNE